MENLEALEIQRLPGEKREVFLSRMLLLLVSLLEQESPTGTFTALHDALANDSEKSRRKGRNRPQRQS